MGIIKRQTIHGSLFTYLGVLVGFITIGILFPDNLTTEQVGLINILIAYTTIFAQFASLGFNNATFRLFTYFRDPGAKHNGFLFLAISTALAGFLISVIMIFFLKPYLTYSSDLGLPTLLMSYYNYIIPMVFFVLFFNLFDTYYTVLYNSTIGLLLKELLLRVLILLFFIGFIFHLFSFSGFVKLFTFSYFLPLALIVFFLVSSRQISLKPKFDFLDRKMIKTLSAVSLFGMLSYTTDILVFNIDRIMIERYLGLGYTGIYSTAFLFGSIVMLPSRSLFKISTTIIADAWKNKDYGNLADIYRKSCVNQFLAGVFVFILITVNLGNIMHILPEAYHEGKYVILLISLAMLVNMAVGVNNVVIMTSQKYRMNTYFLFMLAALLILFNLILIPEYGILGAAIATLASKIFINVMRVIYVKSKFGLQPYNYKFILILLICGISFLVNYFIPVNNNYIADILVRSLSIAAVIIVLSLILKVSDELGGTANNLFCNLKRIFRH